MNYCISSCFGAKKHCLVGDVDGIGTPVWAFACREGMTAHRGPVLVMSTVVDPQPSTGTALCLYCRCAFKRNAHRSMNPSCAARSPTPSRLASAGDLPQRCCQLDWQQEGARLLHWSPKVAALAARIAGHSRIRGGIDAGVGNVAGEGPTTLVTFLHTHLLRSACLRRGLASRVISTTSKRVLGFVNGELGRTGQGCGCGRLCLCHGSLGARPNSLVRAEPVAFALVGAKPNTH